MEEQKDMSPSVEPPAEVNEKNAIGYGWLRALLFFIAYSVLTVMGSIVMAVGLGVTSEADFVSRMDTPAIMWFYMALTAVLLVMFWLFATFLDRKPMISFGYRLNARYGRDLLVGLLWGIGLITVVFGIVWGLGYGSLSSGVASAKSLLYLAVVIIFAAAIEEIVIRGYLLPNCMESMNKYLALIVTSVVFSAGHLLNPNLSLMAVLNIILAGLLLGIYYVHHRNLWLPITMHVAWNYFQGAVYGSPVSGIRMPSVYWMELDGPKLLTGGEFGLEASLITTIVLIAGTVALHLIYRKRSESPAVEQSNIAPTI